MHAKDSDGEMTHVARHELAYTVASHIKVRADKARGEVNVVAGRVSHREVFEPSIWYVVGIAVCRS